MDKNDDSLARAGDILQALQLLTRLPVPGETAMRGGAAAWAYPVAGVVIGALAAVAGLLAHTLGLPAPLCALMALATCVMITGALHEDGLADTFDGLWGGWTVERRLEIMKDSRIGAYGVIALVLSLAARWSAIWILFEVNPFDGAAGVLVAAVGSRSMMGAVMATLPNARDNGLAAHVGGVGQPTALLGLGVAVFLAILLTGWSGLAALIWAGLVTLGLAAVARAKIGGRTGDILGATQQLAEIAILFSLVA